MSPNILSIAGSDPSGGAGIQADLKTIGANGGYGMCVITALTAQNTLGVDAVLPIDAQFVAKQLASVSQDVRIDAVKIGMLANSQVVAAVAAWLETISAPVVLDPVMIATSGDRLLESDSALDTLLTRADVLTPNTAELAALLGEEPVRSWEELVAQSGRLAAKYSVLVVAKGGHLPGERCPDALVGPKGLIASFDGQRLATKNTHGTGCTLSSALATQYALLGDWAAALGAAKSYLHAAIAAADELNVGSGHGPVNHFAALLPQASHNPMVQWWEDLAELRAGIDELEFITQLSAGTLERGRFEYYLAQDALYLQRYAQVLTQASTLAPGIEAQRFWAQGAQGILEDELQLHRSELRNLSPEPSATTLNYVNHLSSCAGNYAELIAAILPCYWIYQDIGHRLSAANHPGHRYGSWLSTYSSAEFDAATAQAIELVAEAWHLADRSTRNRMWDAFRRSAEHELSFFAQAHLQGVEFSTA